MLTRAAERLLWLLPLAFFALFFAYPVLNLLVTALHPDGHWELAVFGQVFSDSRFWSVLWFTVWLAAASTVLTLLVALPGAWVLARFRFWGKGLIEALAVVAFVMPTVVVAAAVSSSTERLGVPGLSEGVPAILLAHLYLNVGVVLRLVGNYWSQLDPQVEEAAAALGAPPWRRFLNVTWPRLAPAVLASSAIVFLFTFTSFGVVLILGRIGQANLEVLIYRKVVQLFNLPEGAVLAIVQIILVAVLLVVQSWLSRRLETRQGLLALPRLQRPRTAGQRSIVAAFLVCSLALLAGPIVAVFLDAFGGSQGWSLTNYAALGTSNEGTILFVSPIEAVRNSLVFAVAATVIALIIGSVVAFVLSGRASPLTESIWLLPLGVSAVTLGFGLLITFDEPPVNFRGSAALIPIAQALVAIPFVTRAVLPTLRSVRGNIREAAATLGATPLQTWRFVDLPMIVRGLAVAAGFAMAISLGEFGATVFLARSEFPTIPIAIYRFLGSPGDINYGQAMALSSILIVVTALVVVGTDRLRTSARYL